MSGINFAEPISKSDKPQSSYRTEQLKSTQSQRVDVQRLVVDVETTGLDSQSDEILQLAICNGNGEVIWNKLYKPYRLTSWEEASQINGIYPKSVRNAPFIHQDGPTIQDIFNRSSEIVIYNAEFDAAFLRAAGFTIDDSKVIDTMIEYADFCYDCGLGGKWRKLEQAAADTGYGRFNAHDALADVKATAYIQNWLDTHDASAMTNTFTSLPMYSAPQEQPQGKVCPRCGEVSPYDAKKCVRCGLGFERNLKPLFIVLAIIMVLGAISALTSSNQKVTVPDLVGQNLSQVSAVKDINYFDVKYMDADGKEPKISNKSDWVVREQNLTPGAKVSKYSDLVLRVENQKDDAASQQSQSALSASSKEVEGESMSNSSASSAKNDTRDKTSNEIVVPNLVGSVLADVSDDIKGFDVDYQRTDGSSVIVWDRSNWRVDEQSLAPDATVEKNSKLVLTLTNLEEEAEAAERANREYVDVDLAGMYDELQENALNAKEKYEGMYIRVTGNVSTIDASGGYISLGPLFGSISCDIRKGDDATINKVRSLSRDSTVTVCGEVTMVGEVLGYSMDIDYIE